MSVVKRLESVFPGKIGTDLHAELAAAVAGFQGLTICETGEAGDFVLIYLEGDAPSQAQLDALDVVIAAHNPPTSLIEDATQAAQDYLDSVDT